MPSRFTANLDAAKSEDRNMAVEMATWGPQRSIADECSLTCRGIVADSDTMLSAERLWVQRDQHQHQHQHQHHHQQHHHHHHHG